MAESTVMILSDSDIQRFWSKVDRRSNEECWEWRGGTFDNGYGVFKAQRKTLHAHSVAWCLANGRQPSKGFHIAHKPVVCHNRICCNPAHLDEKTPAQNAADMILDGTNPQGGRANGWETHPDKMPRGEKHGMAKLSRTQVDQIKELRKKGLIQKVVAKMFGVSFQQVSNIDRGKSWK